MVWDRVYVADVGPSDVLLDELLVFRFVVHTGNVWAEIKGTPFLLFFWGGRVAGQIPVCSSTVVGGCCFTHTLKNKAHFEICVDSLFEEVCDLPVRWHCF